MSNRTLVELNHDYCPVTSGTAEWGENMARYMRSGNTDFLPQGVEFIEQHHHSLPGVIERLSSDLTAAQERIRLLTEAIEGAEHAADCASQAEFIHVEPCPFWTKNYCLMEKCSHGILMGDLCGECPGPQISRFGQERCHPAPCNCWKKAVLAPKEPTDERTSDL